MKILHIDSSASDARTSHSRRLSADIVAALNEKHADASVTYRDVAKDRLPHIDTTIRDAWNPDSEKDAALTELAERSGKLVDELKAADIVVIGAPMYNFTVPSTLKAWIDHVAIAGQTFKYTEQGPKGLLSSKAYLALSSGGVYTSGPAEKAEHLGTYLATVLGTSGHFDRGHRTRGRRRYGAGEIRRSDGGGAREDRVDRLIKSRAHDGFVLASARLYD